ncbi:hypothetical protein, partial [Cupriavidus metallidurans]
CPTARNIGDGRCRSRPSITVLAHPSNLVLTHSPYRFAPLQAPPICNMRLPVWPRRFPDPDCTA